LSRIRGFDLLRAQAEKLPLPDASLDCVLTFNAVHHFNVAEFLREVGRVIRSAGLLFIYTRLRDQNERSIWGQCFPGFTHKETRLLDEEQLTKMLGDRPELAVRELARFSFQRTATRDCLRERVRSQHYSTFCFYEPDELEAATRQFEIALTKRFGTSEVIRWRDEYAMAIAERTSLRPGSTA
jgi:SAM-dependent methyltransferase